MSIHRRYTTKLVRKGISFFRKTVTMDSPRSNPNSSEQQATEASASPALHAAKKRKEAASKAIKQQLTNIGKEMFAVSIGILVALIINAFVEIFNNKRFVDRSLDLLSKEHAENIDNIENTIKFHRDLQSALSRSYGKSNVNVGEVIFEQSNNLGFRSVKIKNTAWNNLLGQNIKLLDYEVISLLTDIDFKKESLDEFTIIFNEYLYEHLLDTEEESKFTVVTMLRELIRLELEAKLVYERFDSYVEEYGGTRIVF